MKPNIIGGPIGSDTDLMLDVYMTREQREAYERLRKDAARFRFLRNDPPTSMCVRINREGCAALYTDGETLDEAIDAAMNGANA